MAPPLLGKFFFPRLVDYMTSGPVEALVLEGPNAVARWRALMGPTHPPRARIVAPTSIRARFGMTDTRNATHGSDAEAARSEISLVFGRSDEERPSVRSSAE